jgi:TatD DNase family protein
MNLFDTHCHLTDSRFNGDMADIIDHGRQTGLRGVLTVGTGLQDLQAALNLTETFPEDMLCAVSGGFTPFDIQESEEPDLEQMETVIRDDSRVKAVGEIGLDRHHAYTEPEREEDFFVRQLEMARRLDLPVIVHCREAHARMRVLLKEHAADLNGVIHCFSGTPDDARAYIELGFSLSFTCAVGYRNAGAQQDAVREIPLDRVMAETDAPYLPPADRRGSRNEPANVAEVVGIIAELKQLAPEEAAEQLYTNSTAFFGVET